MEIIKRYQSQHKIIITLCKQLLSLGTINEVKQDPEFVLKIFTTLDNILSLHLQSEDENLYPQLLTHNDPLIKSTSVAIRSELVETTNAYTAYKNKYLSKESIQHNPQSYVNDTKTIINALLTRIEKEETELYSLFN